MRGEESRATLARHIFHAVHHNSWILDEGRLFPEARTPIVDRGPEGELICWHVPRPHPYHRPEIGDQEVVRHARPHELQYLRRDRDALVVHGVRLELHYAARMHLL